MYKAMKKDNGAKKGKSVYYATKNKDGGFYGHMSVPKHEVKRTSDYL